MSYQWVSGKYESTNRFPKEFYKEYGNLQHIAAYKDPLYAFATLNPKGTMKIEGVKSDWIFPSPYDLGMPQEKERSPNFPHISDYQIKF